MPSTHKVGLGLGSVVCVVDGVAVPTLLKVACLPAVLAPADDVQFTSLPILKSIILNTLIMDLPCLLLFLSFSLYFKCQTQGPSWVALVAFEGRAGVGEIWGSLTRLHIQGSHEQALSIHEGFCSKTMTV